MPSPRDRTQARPAAPGCSCSAAAMRLNSSTRSRLCRKLSPWKRGIRRRASPSRQIVGCRHRAGQKAAAERAVGDKADAELAAERQDSVLDLADPQRILDLHRAIGCTAWARRIVAAPASRDAEMPDLAGAHQLGSSRRPCPRSAPRIDAVDVIEVDHSVFSRARLSSQHSLTYSGPSPVGELAAALQAHIAELAGDHVFRRGGPATASAISSSLRPAP